MKICPCCGTENEQDAIRCQLCNVEFDLNAGLSEKAVQITDNAVMQKITINEENHFQQPVISQNASEEFVSETGTSEFKNSNKGLYIIITVLVLVILAGVVIGFQYFRKQNVQPEQYPTAESNPTLKETIQVSDKSEDKISEETVQDIETSMLKQEVIQRKSTLLSESTGTSAEKVYSDFYQILQKSDAPGGYLYDIDHDGKDDMILKDTDKMDFILYTHDKSGNLSMTHFGSFLAWGDDDFYDITGTDGIHYIYYYDEYMHHSIQGVFNPQTGNELDFSDGYSEEEIQNMLSQAGFQTKGGNYSKLEMLYYDALCQKTTPVETIPATEKRNPPSISCEIKGQISEMDGGG
ncbi:MAG: hypothetical protein IKI37_03560, partial [Oscillospiraceae bacterium]|nr:hypothetical protein [Oscillospiraceae bacterium]